MLRSRSIHTTKLDEDPSKIYIYHEPLDLQRDYDDKIFVHNFGAGDKTYKWVFHDCNSIIYAAIKEVPSMSEFSDLKHVCQCVKCTSKWYNICAKLQKDVGCLHDDNFSQKVLNDTRMYQHNLLFT